MPASAPRNLVLAFIVLAATDVVLFVAGSFFASRRLGEDTEAAGAVAVRAFIGAVVWLGLTFAFASSGVLARFDLEPAPLGALFIGALSLAAAVGLSHVGDRLARGLPLAVLVGAQGLRLPLEMAMHRAAHAGVMPVQMSLSGYNFDVLTGLTAIGLGFWLWLGDPPRAVVVAWNGLGIVLLATIVGIAIASTPMVHAFGADPSALNTFVAYVPFVWLPAVLVAGAVVGHIVVTRRLLEDARSE